MRKILVIAMLCLAIVSCQQKQEPKPQERLSADSVRMMEEIRMLQEVVGKDPRNLEALIKLGNLLMDSSRFSEAIGAYEKALELDPKNADVRVDMGTCYKNIGKPEEAVEQYRKVLKTDPKHLSAQRNLAVVLAFDLRDNAQALKEFEKYLKLAPDAPDAAQVRQTMEALKTAK